MTNILVDLTQFDQNYGVGTFFCVFIQIEISCRNIDNDMSNYKDIS